MSICKVWVVLPVVVFIVGAKASKIFVKVHKYPSPKSCMTNEDCIRIDNSTCENGFCRCHSSIICEDKPSRLATKLGEKCFHNKDCDIEQAMCSEEKCVCKPDHVASETGERCLYISERIGDSCEESVQCYTNITFSGCTENKCMCQQQTHEYNGACYRDVELDQHCENIGECAFVKFSECIESRCRCIQGYVASSRGSRCIPVAEGLRSLCVDNAQCTKVLGEGSECLSGTCDCKEMHQFNNKTKKCVMDILLGEICENHSDCHEPYRGVSRLECILGECKCKSFYTEIDGYCISSSENLKNSLIFIIFQLVLLYMLL